MFSNNVYLLLKLHYSSYLCCFLNNFSFAFLFLLYFNTFTNFLRDFLVRKYILNRIKFEFSRRSPNFLYLVVKWLYHFLFKPSKLLLILPCQQGYWIAKKYNITLYIPSPKGDWASYMID